MAAAHIQLLGEDDLGIQRGDMCIVLLFRETPSGDQQIWLHQGQGMHGLLPVPFNRPPVSRRLTVAAGRWVEEIFTEKLGRCMTLVGASDDGFATHSWSSCDGNRSRQFHVRREDRHPGVWRPFWWFVAVDRGENTRGFPVSGAWCNIGQAGTMLEPEDAAMLPAAANAAVPHLATALNSAAALASAQVQRSEGQRVIFPSSWKGLQRDGRDRTSAPRRLVGRPMRGMPTLRQSQGPEQSSGMRTYAPHRRQQRWSHGHGVPHPNFRGQWSLASRLPVSRPMEAGPSSQPVDFPAGTMTGTFPPFTNDWANRNATSCQNFAGQGMLGSSQPDYQQVEAPPVQQPAGMMTAAFPTLTERSAQGHAAPFWNGDVNNRLNTLPTGFEPEGMIPFNEREGMALFNERSDMFPFNETSDMSLFSGTSDLFPFNETSDLSPFNEMSDMSAFDETSDMSPFLQPAGMPPFNEPTEPTDMAPANEPMSDEDYGDLCLLFLEPQPSDDERDPNLDPSAEQSGPTT